MEPREVNLMRAAITTMSGAKTVSPNDEQVMSKRRFIVHQSRKYFHAGITSIVMGPS
jgi:hypothetical protein